MPICGFYYHYYKKNSEINAYRLQLWTELKSHSINKEEYFRKWQLQVVEWKELFEKCELLESSVVFLCLLSGTNLIIYFKNKKRLARSNKGSCSLVFVGYIGPKVPEYFDIFHFLSVRYTLQTYFEIAKTLAKFAV